MPTHVGFNQHFLVFALHLSKFSIQFLDLNVLLVNEESEVLHLVLQLAQGRLPLKVCVLQVLLSLDDFQVQAVALLGQALVLLLEREEGLLVKAVFIGENSQLVLGQLVGFSRLKQVCH